MRLLPFSHRAASSIETQALLPLHAGAADETGSEFELEDLSAPATPGGAMLDQLGKETALRFSETVSGLASAVREATTLLHKAPSGAIQQKRLFTQVESAIAALEKEQHALLGGSAMAANFIFAEKPGSQQRRLLHRQFRALDQGLQELQRALRGKSLQGGRARAGPSVAVQATRTDVDWAAIGARTDRLRQTVEHTKAALTNAEIDSVILRHALPAEAASLSSLKNLPELLEQALDGQSIARLSAGLKPLHGQLLELYIVQKSRGWPLKNLEFIQDLVQQTLNSLGRFYATHGAETGPAALPGLATLLRQAKQILDLAGKIHSLNSAVSALNIAVLSEPVLDQLAPADRHAMMSGFDITPLQIIEHSAPAEKLRFALSALPLIDKAQLPLLAEMLAPAEVIELFQAACAFHPDKQTVLSLALVAEKKNLLLQRRQQFELAKKAHAGAAREFAKADSEFITAKIHYHGRPLDPDMILQKAAAEVGYNEVDQAYKKAILDLLVSRAGVCIADTADADTQLGIAIEELGALTATCNPGQPGNTSTEFNTSLDHAHLDLLARELAILLPHPQLDQFCQHVRENLPAQGLMVSSEVLALLDHEAGRKKNIAAAEQALMAALSRAENDTADFFAQPDMPASGQPMHRLQVLQQALIEAKQLAAGSIDPTVAFETLLESKASKVILERLRQMVRDNPQQDWSALFSDPLINAWATVLQKIERHGFYALSETEQDRFLLTTGSMLENQDLSRECKRALVEEMIDNLALLRSTQAQELAFSQVRKFTADFPAAADEVCLRLLRQIPGLKSLGTKTSILRHFKHSRSADANIDKSIAAINAIRFCEHAGFRIRQDAHGAAYELFRSSMAMASRPDKVRAHQALLEQHHHLARSRRPGQDGLSVGETLGMGLLLGAMGGIVGTAGGLFVGMIHSLFSAGVFGRDVGITAAVGAGLPAASTVVASVAYTLKRAESAHDAAFHAMISDLDVHADPALSTSAEKALALQQLAPLWQSVLAKLPDFDPKEQRLLLALYLDQTDPANPHALTGEDLETVQQAMAPHAGASNGLRDLLPQILPAMQDKPLLYMQATKFLSGMLEGCTTVQKERALGAITQALDYTAPPLGSIRNPLKLRNQPSRKTLEQAIEIQTALRRLMGDEEALRRLEEGGALYTEYDDIDLDSQRSSISLAQAEGFHLRDLVPAIPALLGR